MKPTDGPYIVILNPADECYDICTDEPDGHTFICDCRGVNAAANARLLAASWDMFQLCQELQLCIYAQHFVKARTKALAILAKIGH